MDQHVEQESREEDLDPETAEQPSALQLPNASIEADKEAEADKGQASKIDAKNLKDLEVSLTVIV